MTLMSKWRVWPWGALAGVGVVALVVLLRFVFLAPGTAQASSSVLSVISPPVEVQGEGEASPRPAVDGEILHAGDLVRTGAGGRAVITFYEGTTATLEPGTEVVIQAMERRGAGGFFTSLRQSIGVTWNRVVELADPASGYEVETPAGTGTVRGTAFKVVVEEDGSAVIGVKEGMVLASGGGEEVAVGEGMQTFMVPGGPPGDPTSLPESGN